jgi:hypothetical protein
MRTDEGMGVEEREAAEGEAEAEAEAVEGVDDGLTAVRRTCRVSEEGDEGEEGEEEEEEDARHAEPPTSASAEATTAGVSCFSGQVLVASWESEAARPAAASKILSEMAKKGRC